MNNFFSSLINFVVAIFFMLIGVVGLVIPWSAPVRALLTKFIFEDSLALSLFGFTFFVIGLAIAIHVLLNAKHSSYKIHSHDNSMTVEREVIQTYLNNYLKQLFPKSEIPCHLTFKENKIHVVVDLPYLPIPEQKPLLERIRKELVDLFRKILAYEDDFFLVASFQKNPPV